jgi:DNA-binding beta-propeller fold protein YncE
MPVTKTKIAVAVAFALGFVGLGVGQLELTKRAEAAAAVQTKAPAFQVDPFWPKPLPNHWILGNVIGVAVDQRDHIYIVHRTQDQMFRGATEIGLKMGVSECCTPAPPVIEFDPDGNMVKAWGGPGEGYTWPASNHGMEIDSEGNVWIGGNGGSYGNAERKVDPEPWDSHILKFTRDGKFLQQIGEPGKARDSNSTTHFGQVAEIAIDEKLNEAYVADGYGNKRVVVLDTKTGGFKRYWGAYGNKPVDEAVAYKPGTELPKQFRGPVHCAQPSNDGLLYVCDRGADRIQVFTREGKFVKEKQIAPNTLAQGSTWDVAFSKDPKQTYMYVVDGQNMKVWILERESLEILTNFGDGGRQPGLWYAPHSIITDSKGNIYTTETYDGKRIQKFVYQGLKAIPKNGQGVAWPAKSL